MAHLLFLTWYGAGNQVPAIGLAQELTARGHRVHVAGYAAQRDRFEQCGFAFSILPGSHATYRADEPAERVLAAVLDGVWACPAHLGDVAELLATGPWDAVVADCMMFGALAALEGAPVPTAVLVHSTPGGLAPPGGPGEDVMLAAVNDIRTHAGRPPAASLWETWAPFDTLRTSVAELDPLAPRVPPSFRYVGPIPERVPPSGWRAPWPTDDPRPLVMLTFSTGHAWDQTSRISRTLDALADGDRYRLLALTAGADVSDLEVPPHAALIPYLPHGEVLPDVAVTVTHAGHGTVAASLGHAVPIVALPNPAADQPALAARVHELGAGIALDGETATAAEIGSAVDTVLRDDAYRTAARALASSIAASPGAATAADLVERLARRGR